MFTVAEPSPAKNSHEKFQVPGAYVNTSRGLKCVAPPQMSQRIVPTTPTHRSIEIFPIEPVEQRYEHDHQRAGNRFLSVLSERMEVGRILGKTDCTRRQAERRLDQRLPDKQERHHAPQPARTISFAQEYITAAGQGHGRAEFRPHEAVEKRQHRSRNPRQQRLRPAHGFDDQGNHDKWADAHHLDHVQRDGLFQTQSAL